ncbi:hypothetical protein JT06_16100 [Desulfobulbus sp. Tol-SR]|nr:hypothetical protein JT06_16100 [Desulfobulbus sp. Tol-SR]
MNRKSIMRVFRAEVELAGVVVTGQWSDKCKSGTRKIKYRVHTSSAAICEIGEKVGARTGASFEVSEAVSPYKPHTVYIQFYE